MNKAIILDQFKKGIISTFPFLSILFISYYVVKFTSLQSIFLAFLFQLLFEKIKSESGKVDFKPHYLTITFKWKWILEIPDLFDDAEKESIRKYLNSEEINPSKQAISNLHLQFISKQLTYLYNFKSFKGSRLHFNVQLSEDVMGPRLWIKSGHQGYEIQVATDSTKINSRYPGDDNGYYVVAIIPYEIASFYYGKDSIDISERKKIIESYGLKYEDQPDMGFWVDPVFDNQYYKLEVGSL